MTTSMATFHDGIKLAARTVPFGSTSLQHGTAVFEGIRGYTTPDGPALFRLDDHLTRLLQSARLLGIEPAYDLAGARSHVLAAASSASAEQGGDLYVGRCC